jgi:prepilin-type N-terminal cleavage/methylation domain-containing protein
MSAHDNFLKSKARPLPRFLKNPPGESLLRKAKNAIADPLIFHSRRWYSCIYMQVRFKEGFTILELLVVIAIVGLLSAVILASLTSSRAKGRDARRKQDLIQIRNALALYYDKYGTYPPAKPNASCNTANSGETAWADSTGTCGGQWLTTDANFYQFLANVPVDPTNVGLNSRGGTGSYVYTYYGWSTDYDLIAQLESTSDSQRCGVTLATYHGGNQPWCAPWANNIGRSQQIIADH